MGGTPNLETSQVLRWTDHAGHVDFAPVSRATGEDALAQYALVRDLTHEAGRDYMGTFIVGRRDLHHVNLMLFEVTDPQDRRRTLELCRELIAAAAARGWGAYRAHPAIMDQVAATYGFNDHALLRLSARIKDALDPAGVLAPGKQGIWPRGLRGAGERPEVTA